MRLLGQFCLLGWLASGFCQAFPDGAIRRRDASTAPKANLKIWDIDETCSNYRDGRNPHNTGMIDVPGGTDEMSYLQESFDRALAMIIAARDSLEFCLGKRPDSKTDEVEHLKWNRISESMGATLGFHAKPDKVEKANDENWKNVLPLFQKMAATLQATKNDPEYGYIPRLSSLPNPKPPLIVCGDNFEWVDKTDIIPGESITLEYLYKSKTGRDLNASGAWYKKHRLQFSKEREKKPIFCRPNNGATTVRAEDMIVLCDITFTAAAKNAWVDPADVKEGGRLSSFIQNLPSVLVHEFTHFYTLKRNSQGQLAPTCIDQQAVNDKGYALYDMKDEEEPLAVKQRLTVQQMQQWEAMPIKAYAVNHVWNLARDFRSVPLAAGYERYAGPAYATTNADSLAIFALMMYHDKWNWAGEGIARPLGPIATD